MKKSHLLGAARACVFFAVAITAPTAASADTFYHFQDGYEGGAFVSDTFTFEGAPHVQ